MFVSTESKFLSSLVLILILYLSLLFEHEGILIKVDFFILVVWNALKVAKYAALSKEEWEEQCKLWPTSYHPPTYNIDGITGFNEEDSQSIFNFMKFAIELALSGLMIRVNYGMASIAFAFT
ncbi:hypothetical protein NE237_001664 [Protea cynaroides]|uniref:Uncharacterized protein n=1 Tax=Protea cynaroides TaxID=273540 RepID=A0A9Q0QYA8_9MAGN|nr:hypothetical protein NE237_001664 [Protea cynaroides]